MKLLRKLKALLLNLNFPHMVKPCAHCHYGIAGFWVMRKEHEVVRRPWCLNCLSDPDMDLDQFKIVSFEGYPLRRDYV